MPRATDDPNVVEFVFVEAEPVPAEISPVPGDVVHSLRSSLDSLVFGLTAEGLSEPLTPKQEKACQFPIATTPDEFDDFFDNHQTRRSITVPALRDRQLSPCAVDATGPAPGR